MKLPSHVAEYKRTAVFDTSTVPSGLLRSHTLKAGTWGEIVVVAGRVRYVIEGNDDAALVLDPQNPGTIEPEVPHHVELLEGARFFVRFLR